MKKYLVITLFLIQPALAQDVDLNKAAVICAQHRHPDPAKRASHQGIRDMVDEPGYEHCPELLELKIEHDKSVARAAAAASVPDRDDKAALSQQQTDIEITRWALDRLKTK